ncbi:MAG: ribbon-helix-helix protein, CopG family [Longimicrobiales bacterium]|nr:ribbon-helix-helix protein, CopG family [Longimicrobiales bacterium]
MTERIHILLDGAEKERFRRWAEREGKSLSEWLREAAREKLAAARQGRSLDSREALEDFFEGCDARERGEEPDWESHRRVIEDSIRSGAGST